MSKEPKKKYLLVTEVTRRLNLYCQVTPFTRSYIKSVARTRDCSQGRAVDFVVAELVKTRELHERIKEHKKTLQFLKNIER